MPSFAYATPASALTLRFCLMCLISSSRPIRHPDARRLAWASAWRWYAVWWNVMVAASLRQVPAAATEASSRFICQRMQTWLHFPVESRSKASVAITPHVYKRAAPQTNDGVHGYDERV